MGLKRFFKKAGGWIRDKFHKAKEVVKKFAKPVVRVVKNVTDFIGKTPLAPIINTATGGAFNVVHGLTKLIPDGAVKDKVENFTKKAEQVRDQAASKVQDLQDKANTVIDKGKQAISIINNARPMVTGIRKHPGLVATTQVMPKGVTVKPFIDLRKGA